MAFSTIFGRRILIFAASLWLAVLLWMLHPIAALAWQAGQSSDSRPPAAQSSKKHSSHNGTAAGKQSDTESNPFPQAQSEAAAKKERSAQGGGTVPNSSPPSGYSSSDANLPPSFLGEGALGSKPKLDTYTRDHTLDGRIEDDLKVAGFYMKRGNYRGAQWRFQDALQYDPQNETALYGVAEAMCKQNLTADAMARFKSYAKSYPQGKYALKAEKMLSHPDRCEHNW